MAKIKVKPKLKKYPRGGKVPKYEWSKNEGNTYPITPPQNNYTSSLTTGNKELSAEELKKAAEYTKQYNQKHLEEEYNNRQSKLKASVDAQKQPLSLKNLQTQTQSTGDKFSLAMNTKYGNPKDYPTLSGYMEGLDYINPAKIIGDMSSGIGSVPQDVKDGNYLKAGMSIGSPLFTGAVAGIGTQNIGQFTNNIANPFAGMGDLAKTGLRETVDIVHPVGRKLKEIEKEGLSQGLSPQAIKNRQMQEIGITSLQRKGYFPGVSEVLSEYLVPYSYDNAKKRLLDIPKKIIKGDTNTKRLADLDKVILDQGENTLSKPRYDAWRMYSGLPQKYGTFRMAETSPINHLSYTQNQLNNLEKFSLNDEKKLLNVLPSEYDYFRYAYDNEYLLNNVSYLKDQLKDINNLQKKGIDFPQSDFTTTNVMGGHNRRFFDNKMEYNDVWDLDLNGLKVDRYFGKPFMSHGQLEYSFEPAKKSINNLLRKAELLDNNINIFKGKSKYNFDDIKLNNYNNLIDTKVQKKKIGGKINNSDWEIIG